VTCGCGHVAAGVRRAHAQTVACSGCGGKVFVLPYSRLPPVKPLELSVSRNTKDRASASPWHRPLTAAGLTLVLVAAVFAAVLASHGRKNPSVNLPVESAGTLFERGQKALAEGKVRIAADYLSAAQAALEHAPAALTHAERRRLAQLRREALLLADLLAEPLEDVLAHAAALSELDEREWQAHFAARYRGKAVLFEDEVRREVNGAYQLLGYHLFVRGQPARLALADLRLLRALPLDRPQRLLFGARLADVRPEAGAWVVHFEPDSGVLITDAGAAAAGPLPAPELDEILRRQSAWLDELP
jgi:hypothetical protein